jgi:L-ascorbate metabolism protein UlaG (beta-lactamase superfamily)
MKEGLEREHTASGGSVPDGLRPHRDGRGRFWCPWLPRAEQVKSTADLIRWSWERLRYGVPPDPAPGSIPVAPADPSTLGDADHAVWVGHATFLIRVGGLTVLTDPVWSPRASPLPWAGPRRYQPPGLPFEHLPGIDAVLISHDHYDHLDRRTVRALARGPAAGARWLAPLGHGDWLRRQGAGNVSEMDWWDEVDIGGGPGEGEGSRLRVTALPAQHWTRRSPWSTNRRLWCGFAMDFSGARESRRVLFVGDSGYFEGLNRIGRHAGPFDVSLIPIGAYEPRWFMEFAHMNPEEAVRAYRDLGGRGLMVTMHWGTFRLTDESPLEPPVRARRAWNEAGLPAEDLKILRHGEAIHF